MMISLDTNVWIFGLLGGDYFSQKIVLNLSQFNVIVPNQIRAELSYNLGDEDMKRFYKFVINSNIRIDYDKVPAVYVSRFEAKGLKKGDAIIGAYCEWRKVEVIVSDNRDFLRGLSAEHHFEVMSPQEFCEKFGL